MAKTDKELFRDYLMSKEKGQSDNVGALYLTGHECFGIDEMLRDVVNSIVNADPEPVAELDFLMDELRGLLHNLAHVKKGFVAYKAARRSSMNAARRKRIEEAMDRLSFIKDEVDSILCDEQDAYEGMPEGLKSSARGEAAENAVGSLETASSQIEEAMGELSAAMEAA
jgi:hypothetical protein